MMEVAGHVTLTASGVVKGRGGALVAILLTAGLDAASVILYDNPSAGSGVILSSAKAPASQCAGFCPAVPYAAASGIYATITGTDPLVTVVFL